MQILIDNGYNDVSEIQGGIESWTNAGYPVVTSISYSTENLTKVLTPFSLIPDDTKGTPIPMGSTIYHWANKVTEVVGPDGRRFLIALDLEAATFTTSTGDVRPVTWIYLIPPDTTRVPGNDSEDFYLGDRLILSVVTKSEDYSD